MGEINTKLRTQTFRVLDFLDNKVTISDPIKTYDEALAYRDKNKKGVAVIVQAGCNCIEFDAELNWKILTGDQ